MSDHARATPTRPLQAAAPTALLQLRVPTRHDITAAAHKRPEKIVLPTHTKTTCASILLCVWSLNDDGGGVYWNGNYAI